MSKVIVESVQTSEAYGMAGYSRIVENSGKTYLVRDEWCGSDVEGACFREHVYLIPDDLVAKAVKSLQQPQEKDFTEEGYTIPAPAQGFWEDNIDRLRCLGRNHSL